MLIDLVGKKPTISETAFVAPGAMLIGDVSLGDFASVWYNAVVRADEAEVRIGNNTNVQSGAVLHANRESIVVGSNTTISHGAILEDCKVGNDCIIGVNSVILSGAKLGSGCILGAGSVVLSDKMVGDDVVLAGRPAKALRRTTSADLKRIESSWKAQVEFMRKHKFSRVLEQVRGGELI